VKELSPQEKIAAAEDFEQHLFWTAVMVPTLQAQIAMLYAKLRTCDIGDVHKVRSELDSAEQLIAMPAAIIATARDDIKLEQFSRRWQDEERASGSDAVADGPGKT